MIRAFACLLCAAVLALAGEACPPFGPSIAFAKGDPAISIGGMRGKAVLIVFGQSWCPICNGWTPQLIPQLEKAWAADPGVVLLLVKTDGDASEARSYLASHGGDPSRWFVAGDAGAAWVKQVMGKDELWQYAIVDPAGQLVERGKAGMFMGGDAAKRFTLAESRALKTAAAAATRLLPADPPLPASLARAARLAEVGCFAEAQAATASASPADRKSFAAALQTGASTRVTALTAQLGAGGVGLMPAYMGLRDIAVALKGGDAAKQAQEAMKTVAKDPTVTRELAAERAWNGAMARAAALPVSRREAAVAQMKIDYAKTYGDTWFAGTVGAAR